MASPATVSRAPVRCGCGCRMPAGYLVTDEWGRKYLEVTSKHHGQQHTTRIAVGPVSGGSAQFETDDAARRL